MGLQLSFGWDDHNGHASQDVWVDKDGQDGRVGEDGSDCLNGWDGQDGRTSRFVRADMDSQNGQDVLADKMCRMAGWCDDQADKDDQDEHANGMVGLTTMDKLMGWIG